MTVDVVGTVGFGRDVLASLVGIGVNQQKISELISWLSRCRSGRIAPIWDGRRRMNRKDLEEEAERIS